MTNPEKLLITIEAEPLGGSLAGMVLQCGWHDAPTNTWGWTAVRIGQNLTVGGGIQTYQAVVERPAAWAAGKTIDDVTIRFMPSHAAAGATLATNRVKLHRFDVQVVLADSFIDQQLKTKATVDGMAESSYVMRVKAGGAAAGFEMVAASNPKGPASAIRMSADEILLDGTIKGPKMEIGAIGAREIAVDAIAARHLMVADFTNLVPNADLSDAASWTIPAAWTRGLSGTAFSGMYWTHIDAGSVGSVFSLPFSVEAGAEYLCSIEARSNSASDNMILFAVIQWQQTDGTLLSNSIIRGNAGPVPNSRQTYSASLVAPSGATRARVQWYLHASSTAGRLYVGSPSVRLKYGGKMMLDGDLEARHIKVGTLTGGLMAATGIITKVGQIDDAVIRRAHIGLGEIDELRIKGNAFFVPERFTAANAQIPTANHIGNQRLLLNRTMSGLGDGGFTVNVSAYMATTTHYDCFGGLSLTTTVDGVIVGTASGLQRFGIRTTGGDTGFRIPISMSASAYGGATVRFQLYGYNGHWTGDFERINAETGQYVNPRTSNPFNIEGITLTVSASRR